MFKQNVKLFLLTSIFSTQLSLSTFAMERNDEDKNNNSITHKSPKNEELSQDIPTGSIISFAGTKAPDGWLICDGQEIECTKYKKLFEVIGKTYTNIAVDINIINYNSKKVNENISLIEKFSKLHEGYFCLPDLRGRVIVGPDNDSSVIVGPENDRKRVTSNNKLGESGGEEEHKLTENEMPSHTHGTEIPSSDREPRYGSSGNGPIGLPQVYPANTQNTGGNQPHNNMQPYLVLNYIIKAEENNELDNLKKKIKDLEIQINTPTKLKARYRNSNSKDPKSDWKPYTTVSEWKPITFSDSEFNGDERLRGNLSTIEIPESGVYSLFASYYWRASVNGDAAPYTAIAINSPSNHQNYFVQHHIAKNYIASGGINRVTRLERGEKVMVSIYGHINAEYFLPHFQFDIEKIF